MHFSPLRPLLDLLLPAGCLLCSASVQSPGQFCAACFTRAGFITPPFCARCGLPFGAERHGRMCESCRDRPPSWNRARAALRYDDVAKSLILPLKRMERRELVIALANGMLRAGGPLLAEADLLAPVPLHRRRLFWRGYNQSALLAFQVGRLAGKPVAPDLMRRVRATRSLGHMPAARRAAEVGGAFVVHPSRLDRIAGRRVLLIDDVLTSGATAEACAKALLLAGAAGVDVLAAARTPLAMG